MSRAMRLLVASVVATALAAACSHSSDRSPSSSLTPTAPTAQNVGPVSTVNTIRPTSVANIRPLAVDFPPRNEAFDFRNQLETKYRDGLKRPATSTFVDLEGDVVWTQEYMRLRVNDCDHISAVQKVFTEIDSGGVPTCGAAASSEAAPIPVIAFPPRNEPFDFRRQLELKYQSMGRRSTATFVDIEGIIVWLQEYLRYRVSSCDHASSVQKVFTQIDGGGVQPDCTPTPTPPPPVSCTYTVSPSSQSFTSTGGTFTATLGRPSGSCSWSATSDSSFITLTGPTSGADPTSFGVTVAFNSGGARSGTVTISWSGGSTQIAIGQSAAPPVTVFAAFRMFDSGRQTSPTTECQIRSSDATGSTPTTCTLDASQSFAFGTSVIVSYTWVVQYTYVTAKTLTATTTTPRFSFTDTCGQATSTAEGAIQPLSVQLTVTDSAGNTATVTSGVGSQPALTLRLFTCGQ